MDDHYAVNGDLFVWNQNKAQVNGRKHGVRFEKAAAVFSDPLFVLTDAARNDEASDAAIGSDIQVHLLFVVDIESEATCARIISARREELNEEVIYAE